MHCVNFVPQKLIFLSAVCGSLFYEIHDYMFLEKISLKVIICGPRGDMDQIEFYSLQGALPDIFNNPNLSASIKNLMTSQRTHNLKNNDRKQV